MNKNKYWLSGVYFVKVVTKYSQVNFLIIFLKIKEKIINFIFLFLKSYFLKKRKMKNLSFFLEKLFFLKNFLIKICFPKRFFSKEFCENFLYFFLSVQIKNGFQKIIQIKNSITERIVSFFQEF